MIRQIIYFVCIGIVVIFGVIILFKKIREMNEYEQKLKKENVKND